jgi:small subunit ribosomal protein S20
MPNIKSAKKRLRTSARKTQENRVVRSRINTVRRKLVEAVEAGDAAGAETAYRSFCSALDKAVKKGAIKANNASRRKARAAARVAAVA